MQILTKSLVLYEFEIIWFLPEVVKKGPNS
jgi:hypothetical protein